MREFTYRQQTMSFVTWTDTADACEQARDQLGLEDVMIIDRDITEVTLFASTDDTMWQNQDGTYGKVHSQESKSFKTDSQAALILRSPIELTDFWHLVEKL